jgi:hypothetical protein
VLGALATGLITYGQQEFIASPAQLCVAGLVAVAAIAAARRVRARQADAAGGVAGPLIVGLVSLAASSVFMVARRFAGGWAVVGVYVLIFAVAARLVSSWSARRGWTDRHVVALAGGALLTYAWHAFVQEPVVGGHGAFDHLGDTVFSLLAVGVLLLAVRRTAVVTAAGTSPRRG